MALSLHGAAPLEGGQPTVRSAHGLPAHGGEPISCSTCVLDSTLPSVEPKSV